MVKWASCMRKPFAAQTVVHFVLYGAEILIIRRRENGREDGSVKCTAFKITVPHVLKHISLHSSQRNVRVWTSTNQLDSGRRWRKFLWLCAEKWARNTQSLSLRRQWVTGKYIHTHTQTHRHINHEFKSIDNSKSPDSPQLLRTCAVFLLSPFIAFICHKPTSSVLMLLLAIFKWCISL